MSMSKWTLTTQDAHGLELTREQWTGTIAGAAARAARVALERWPHASTDFDRDGTMVAYDGDGDLGFVIVEPAHPMSARPERRATACMVAEAYAKAHAEHLRTGNTCRIPADDHALALALRQVSYGCGHKRRKSDSR